MHRLVFFLSGEMHFSRPLSDTGVWWYSQLCRDIPGYGYIVYDTIG